MEKYKVPYEEFFSFVEVIDELYVDYSDNENDLRDVGLMAITAYKAFMKRNPQWRKALIQKELEKNNEEE